MLHEAGSASTPSEADRAIAKSVRATRASSSAVGTCAVGPPLPATGGCAADYASRLVVIDGLVVVWVTFGAQLLRFGFDDPATVTTRADGVRARGGHGVPPQDRLRARLRPRGLPVGRGRARANRWIWRNCFARQRWNGTMTDRVLLLSSRVTVTAVARDLGCSPAAGYQVGGGGDPVCDRAHPAAGNEHPRLSGHGRRDRAHGGGACRHSRGDLARRAAAPADPEALLGLELGRQHLVMVPAMTDVGGPGIHVPPVAGPFLVHVETPGYGGSKAFAKRASDIAASGVDLLVLSPVLVTIALIVRFSSPGPALCRQEQNSHEGETFRMFKFPAMVRDPEERLAELTAKCDAGNEVLFKMKDDPRFTPVGRVLKCYSVEEPPQLLNVFGGSMSLVGLRLRSVKVRAQHVPRKFLVKPSISGPCQVNGRSLLSREESVRLNGYCVNNWSLTGDFVIFCRTAKAVLARAGRIALRNRHRVHDVQLVSRLAGGGCPARVTPEANASLPVSKHVRWPRQFRLAITATTMCQEQSPRGQFGGNASALLPKAGSPMFCAPTTSRRTHLMALHPLPSRGTSSYRYVAGRVLPIDAEKQKSMGFGS